MNKPRAKTVEEVRKELLAYIHNIAKYWAELPDKTIQNRCDGVVFSILNIFDGTTILPGMDIKLAPHPDDKEYHIENGDKWYEDGMVVNECLLHELWCEKKEVNCTFSTERINDIHIAPQNENKPMGTIICPHCGQIQVGKCDLICDECGSPPWDTKELCAGLKALRDYCLL